MNIKELEKMMKKDGEENDIEATTEIKPIYENEIFGNSFKIYGTKEQPLFLARDIANWIEITNITNMIDLVDDDEKLSYKISKSGQIRQMWFLTRDGLFEVLMQSRKPIAKQFKKEVKRILNEIQLTGGYVVDHREEEFIENHYNYLSSETKNAMLKEMQEHIKAQENLIQQQEEKIKLDAPKVESYDQFMNSDGLYTTTNVAKLLDIKRSDLFEWLRANEYVYKQKTICTEKARQKGYLVMKMVNNYNCMYFTPKGVEWIKENYGI